ncbi:MAG TPA: DUF4142 domain-containing protein, partial [Usitatibacter sp.]|nr:DUF4142 domain-containing protein [Usitatibacter sp.]
REYMKGQVKDHEDVVRAFEREAKHGKDADVRQWASGQQPALREHLEMAEAARESTKAGHDVRDKMRP